MAKLPIKYLTDFSYLTGFNVNKPTANSEIPPVSKQSSTYDNFRYLQKHFLDILKFIPCKNVLKSIEDHNLQLAVKELLHKTLYLQIQQTNPKNQSDLKLLTKSMIKDFFLKFGNAILINDNPSITNHNLSIDDYIAQTEQSPQPYEEFINIHLNNAKLLTHYKAQGKLSGKNILNITVGTVSLGLLGIGLGFATGGFGTMLIPASAGFIIASVPTGAYAVESAFNTNVGSLDRLKAKIQYYKYRKNPELIAINKDFKNFNPSDMANISLVELKQKNSNIELLETEIPKSSFDRTQPLVCNAYSPHSNSTNSDMSSKKDSLGTISSPGSSSQHVPSEPSPRRAPLIL